MVAVLGLALGSVGVVGVGGGPLESLRRIAIPRLLLSVGEGVGSWEEE